MDDQLTRDEDFQDRGDMQDWAETRDPAVAMNYPCQFCGAPGRRSLRQHGRANLGPAALFTLEGTPCVPQCASAIITGASMPRAE